MSIRIKVFLIITGIILVITASSVIISVSAAQNEIIKTLESGMQSVASVANEYISSELDLLMIDAATVVQALSGVPLHDMHGVLMDQLAAFSHAFMSITVFNASGNVDASYGRLPTPPGMALGEFGQQAFQGKRVISTTRQDSSGETVFHVFVPMDESFQDTSRARIAAFTVRGTYLSEKVSQFQRETENIAILDHEGTILANKNQEWVANRLNFRDMLKGGGRHEAAALTFLRMLSGESGADRFVFDDIDAVTAFMSISAPDQNWFITVTTPIAGSAFDQVRMLIIISGFIFLGLGTLAAVFASGSVAKPFYQIRKQNAQLIELGEAVKAAATAKTNFLANMSYDMRTPLNAVIGLSELSLTKSGVPQDIRDYLKRIYGSGMTLMEVVSDLLDISNMESGKFGVIPAEYDLGSFIGETIKVNAEHIGSKPVDIKMDLDDKLPNRLIGDSLRLKQIFNNLLTNAIRYTSVGTVEWKISFERDGDSVWLVSSVTDTGVGIKPENMDRLFIDYNNRLDGTRVRNLEGASGLGLTLIKKIVTLMDGTITVESTLGKGSTFHVRLRQGYITDTAIGSEVLEKLRNFKYVEQKRGLSSLQRVQLPNTRVLVVDDVEINLEIAQGMLEPYGITVDCLTNAQEAVELIRLGDPQYDAIFMSRWMSELDGKEAVRIIRNEIDNKYARTIPIIALIATTLIGNKDVFHSWGFQDVLSKPLNIRHLDEAVNNWLVKK
jgi:signal transduction histidine kinase/CheY-like chemotaxis protein